MRIRLIMLTVLLAAGFLQGAQQPSADIHKSSEVDSVSERAKIQGIVLLLGHPSYEEREAAQAELLELPARWKGFLADALEKTEDTEIQARLSEILEQAGKIRWRQDLSAALTEAGRLHRPLFVFCSQTPPEGLESSSCGGLLCDPAIVDYVNECFIPVWRPAVSLPAGGGIGPDLALFCHPDGTVRHAFSGPWSAEPFLGEARKAVEVYCRLANAQVASVERGASLAKIKGEAAGIEASLPALDPPTAEQARAHLAILRLLIDGYVKTGSLVGKSVLAMPEPATLKMHG